MQWRLLELLLLLFFSIMFSLFFSFEKYISHVGKMEGKRCNSDKLLMHITSPSLQLYLFSFQHFLHPFFSYTLSFSKQDIMAKRMKAPSLRSCQRGCLVKFFIIHWLWTDFGRASAELLNFFWTCSCPSLASPFHSSSLIVILTTTWCCCLGSLVLRVGTNLTLRHVYCMRSRSRELFYMYLFVSLDHILTM